MECILREDEKMNYTPAQHSNNSNLRNLWWNQGGCFHFFFFFRWATAGPSPPGEFLQGEFPTFAAARNIWKVIVFFPCISRKM